MGSCDFVSDYVLSAIQQSDYEKAKRLCEIFSFKNKTKFALLYGIANIMLNNEPVSKLIFSNRELVATFAKEFENQDGASSNTLLKLDDTSQSCYEQFVRAFKRDVSKKESFINRILFSNLHNRDFSNLSALDGSFNLTAEKQIDNIIQSFDDMIYKLNQLPTSELVNLKVTSPEFSGSSALDLCIAKSYLSRSEYKHASKHFERAFISNPYSLEGYEQYSTVLWHLNQKDELLSLYLKFKTDYPNSSQYYIIKGNYYSFTGANEKAINSFRQAYEVDQSATYALFLEGHDWLSLNNIDEAEKAFEKLSRLDPDSYMPYFGLGITNYKKKRYEKSISFLKLASSINPHNFNILCYCSIVLECLGKRSEALDVLLVEDQTNNPIICYRKAKLYESLNIPEKAVEVLKEAIQKFPNDPALFYSLAELNHAQGNVSAAVKLLKRANELELNNPATKDFINNIGI